MLKTKYTIQEKLCYEGTKYESMKKCAVMEDDTFHIVQKMKDGTEYFCIDNPYDDSVDGKIFYGKIGDALKAIREEYADALLCGDHLNVFSSGDSPVILLDMKKGEEYRKKTIEGFKDAKICYMIRMGGRFSFGGYHGISEEGNWTLMDKPFAYESYSAAKEKLNEYLDSAKKLAKKSVDEKNIKLLFNKELPNIVSELAQDMIEDGENELCLIENLEKTPNVGYDIYEVIV